MTGSAIPKRIKLANDWRPVAEPHTLRRLQNDNRVWPVTQQSAKDTRYRFRPHIVHTHTAKAGGIGRLAAAMAGVPIRVHTFHGHVLQGYFPWIVSRSFVWAERHLARLSTRIVTISQRQRSDIIDAYGIAPLARS